MKKLPILLGVLAISGLAAAAGFLTTANAQTSQAPDRQSVQAPIESVEVVPSGAAPTGHALQIVAGLPGGCAEPLDSGFYRDGDTIIAFVTNSEPSDPNTICTKEYRTYDVTIDLGTGFVPDQEYTAYVNGTEVKFIAHGGIVPPDRVKEPAPIEYVDITATLSLPPQYIAEIMAGLPGSCAEPADHFVSREGNTITIDVNNFVPAEQEICQPIYRTYPVNVNLGSDFVSGETYTVLVNGTTTQFVAY